MKKTLLLSLALCLTVGLFAQSQRMVLLEHFTQASCGPCATYNPAVETYLNANPSKAISIKYQVWWPGTDPMYNHNTADVQARANYYGVNSVPNSVIDGNYYNGHPATPFPNGGGSPTIQARSTAPSPFDISVSHAISADYSTVNVTATVKATQAVNQNNLKLHIGVVEKHISFDAAPGSNGETDFFHVMKKLLPSAGNDLTTTWSVGDSVTITQSWLMSNVYDISEIAVVAFVQNNSSKEVFQAGFSEFATMPHANDVSIKDVSEIVVCEGSFVPTVKVQNFGTSNVTALTLQYGFNGGGQATFNWTGNLGSFDETTIQLPAVPMTAINSGLNTIDINLSDVNNSGSDDYSGNDQGTGSVETAPELSKDFDVVIRTDNYGYETYWEVRDINTGTVYGSGGNPIAGSGNAAPGQPGAYGNNQTFTTTVTVPEDACYVFEIIDDYGDGICCGFGNGFYQVNDDQGVQVFTGGDFGDAETKDFKVNFPVSTNEVTFTESLSVFPNPVRDQFTIEFDLENAQKLDISLVNTLGQTVRAIDNSNFAAGNHRINVSANDLAAGLYFVTIRNNDSVVTKRISVNK